MADTKPKNALALFWAPAQAIPHLLPGFSCGSPRFSCPTLFLLPFIIDTEKFLVGTRNDIDAPQRVHNYFAYVGTPTRIRHEAEESEPESLVPRNEVTVVLWSSRDERNDNVVTLCYLDCEVMEKTVRRARPANRETLNLRIKPEERGLIDRAARVLGKNRTDFVLEAARRAAEQTLLDRTVFTVSPKAYAEFLARLDVPPKPNKRLRRTMQTPAPWE